MRIINSSKARPPMQSSKNDPLVRTQQRTSPAHNLAYTPKQQLDADIPQQITCSQTGTLLHCFLGNRARGTSRASKCKINFFSK